MNRVSRLFLALTGLACLVSVAVADTTAPGDVVIENLSIENALTDVAGNAENGRAIFLNRKQGNCLACHANSDMKDQLFHGEVGPSLDGVGARWSEPMLRTILVNYSLDVGADVRKDLIGKTILEAQQIEDLIAYLSQLK